MTTQELTAESFEQTVLDNDICAGGLLGVIVRTVPHVRPNLREGQHESS